MSEKRRLYIMLITVLLLIIANVYMQLAERGVDASRFFASANLEDTWSPRLKKNMATLEKLPELSFRTRKQTREPEEEATRNPFMFGIDRAKERDQREQLAELRRARQASSAAREREIAQEEPAEPKAHFKGKLLGIMENASTTEIKVSLLYEGEYHVLAVGEILANSYKILEISQERVSLLDIPTTQEIVIQMETY